MNYHLEYTEQATNDIKKIKHSGNKPLYKKLNTILLEIQEHPRSGTGQAERLKHYKTETWSRRLNQEHRLVYEIHDDVITVKILSTQGHYK